MIEFLNTLDPVQLSFFIVFLILALVILGIGSHHRINEIYDVGYDSGVYFAKIKSLDDEKVAYDKGREAGILIGKLRAQQSAPNPTKTPVNQPSKPAKGAKAK